MITVLNMFVALCVGMSYVVGYILAISSLILLIFWIIDGKFKTNLSNKFIFLLMQYLPEKDETVICKRCEDVNTIDIENIVDNYCYECGKEYKKNKTSTRDIQVEKMTNKIVLFALAAMLLYSISTTLFAFSVIVSIMSYCLYFVLKSIKSKRPCPEAG